MGGSLIVDNVEPAPYNLEQGLGELYSILQVIKNHQPGWSNVVAIEEYLAGSSSVAIDNRVAMRNKGIELGDIDVFVDKTIYDDFCAIMVGAQQSLVSIMSDYRFLLYFRKGKTRSTSLMKVENLVRQVDFIPCEFENDKPKQFFKFSHSSSIVDMNKGIKGFAHKLLCRAYTAGTTYHFSVDYGLREEGSFDYDTDFISVVNKVFKCNAYKVWSFTSLLKELGNKPIEQQTVILSKFALLVFGKDRQKTSRFPEKDLANMTAVYNELKRQGFVISQITKMYEDRKTELSQ